MAWTIWVILGFSLLIAELFAFSGFFLFYLGLSGIITGLLVKTGFLVEDSNHWYAFGVIAIILLGVFKKKLDKYFKTILTHSSNPDEIVGTIAKSNEEITASSRGRVTLRGASWNAQNVSDQLISLESEVTVVGIDGITLLVKPKQ